MISIIAIIVRALQALLAIVVLGLSVTLLKGQKIGDAPVTTRYSVFLGAYGMIIAALGLVSLFFEAIPALIPLGLDAVGALLFLGGGIAWAIGLKGLSCTDRNMPNLGNLYTNGLLNEGCLPKQDSDHEYPYCAVAGNDPPEGYTIDIAFDALKGNCQRAFADEVIIFISFALAAVLLLLGFLLWKRRGTSQRVYV